MKRLLLTISCLVGAWFASQSCARAMDTAQFLKVWSNLDSHYREFESLQRAAIIEKLKVRAPFLLEPAAKFDATPEGSACPNRPAQPTIFGLLVAIENQITSFGGLQNDLPLLLRSLELRGADRKHIRVLTEKTPRADMLREMEAVLACLRDGDQVFVYLHSDSRRQGDMVVNPFGNPLPRAQIAKRIMEAFECPDSEVLEDPKCEVMSKLWVFRDEIRDRLDRIQFKVAREFDPFSDLVIMTGPAGENGAYSGIRGLEVANFVTAVRNRRADAIMLVDTSYASTIAIQQRQRLAGSEWSGRIDGATGALNEAGSWDTLTRLHARPGEYAVFYSTEHDEVSMELPVSNEGGKDWFQKDAQGKPFGVFTYAFARALQSLDEPSVGEIARTVVETLRSPFKKAVFFPRFESSSSELKVLAPHLPLQRRTDLIDVLSPQLTRGVAMVQDRELEVVARYRGTAGPKVAMIDGVATRIGKDGEFRQKIPLRQGKLEIPLVVVDDSYEVHQRLLPFEAPDTAESVLSAGERYALVITNQNYRDPAFPTLRTPHRDGDQIADILRKRYGFKTEIAAKDGKPISLIVHDASASDIVDAFDTLTERLLPEDTLLVYYAGHGHYDKLSETAYWVGADARPRRTRDYVAASAISESLKRIGARNLMIIADSCYAGALTRAAGESEGEEPRDRALLKSAQKKKRILISSGGNEPVLDSGGGDHSIFAKALIDGLSEMNERMFSAHELFTKYLYPRVAGKADQEPQIAFIRDSGHDGGDFVFVQTKAP